MALKIRPHKGRFFMSKQCTMKKHPENFGVFFNAKTASGYQGQTADVTDS